MQSSVKRQAHSSVMINISLNSKEVKEFFNTALQEAQKETNLEGFRPGKAPENLVFAHLGRAKIEAKGLDLAIQKSYAQAMTEHKLKAIDHPEISVKKFVNPDNQTDDLSPALDFEARVDLLPDFSVEGYQKIKVKKQPEVKVNNEEVETVINHLRSQRATLKDIDRPVKKGDWLEISFEGSLEGVRKDELSSKNFPLILGEGQLVNGFEDQLIGLGHAGKKTFEVIFPANYSRSDLRKRRVSFSLTVLATKERILPEMNGQFFEGLGLKDLDQLKNNIRKSLEQEKEKVRRNQLEDQIITELLRIVKIDLPPSLIKQEEERIWQDLETRLADNHLDLPAYLAQIQKTEDQLKKEIAEQGEKNVKIGLIFAKIMEAESVDDHSQAGMRKVMDLLLEQVQS